MANTGLRCKELGPALLCTYRSEILIFRAWKVEGAILEKLIFNYEEKKMQETYNKHKRIQLMLSDNGIAMQY